MEARQLAAASKWCEPARVLRLASKGEAMDAKNNQLDPDRLFEATNAVMEALEAWAIEHKGQRLYPPDMMGTPDQPRALCDFSRFEIQEATDFLVRMGIIEIKKAAS